MEMSLPLEVVTGLAAKLIVQLTFRLELVLRALSAHCVLTGTDPLAGAVVVG